MRFIKKLLILGSRAFRKVGYLIREKRSLIEVKILLIGLMLTGILGLSLLLLLFMDPKLYGVLIETAALHLMGGRGAGVMICLLADISPLFTIFYNFYLEVLIVLIAYSMVVLIMRNVIEPKMFDAAVRRAELTAQRQKTTIKRYGGVGLFFFVMFPFFMTGPVVGSLIGYLINYRAIHNFLIIFSGTLTSIVIYTLIGNNLFQKIHQYPYIDDIKMWGGIFISVMIIGFLLYHMKTVKKFLEMEVEDD